MVMTGLTAHDLADRPEETCALFQGVDLVEVKALERAVRRSGAHFLRRVYTPAELDTALGPRRFRRLAAVFAAKEAVLKAFGLGIGGGVRLSEIEVVAGPTGHAVVRLRGPAASLVHRWRRAKVLVSLSETREYGLAYVLVLVSPTVAQGG